MGVVDLPTLLQFTQKVGGSDLHLSAGAIPMVRVHGEMKKLEIDGDDLSRPSAVRRLIYGFLTDQQKKRLESEWELDCSMELGDQARFRCNVFLQKRGLGAVFRVIPTRVKTAQELGLPQVIRDLGKLHKGLVLVTGPTGSGKSTTLAALVDFINSTKRGHILTVEDPVEFVHIPKRCMVNQREISVHTKGFPRALKSALREDPDIILVGEMRDTETISLAVTAAETGHLVFGTLHTASASQTVERIVNVFSAEEQQQIRTMLAGSIQAIIAQLLVKTKKGGRTAVHEILIATSSCRAMIREGKTYQLPSVIQTGIRFGMTTVEGSLTRLVREGIVDPRVADEMLAALNVEGDDEALEDQLTAKTAAPPPPSPSKPAEPPRPAPAKGPQQRPSQSGPINVQGRPANVPKAGKNLGELLFVLDQDAAKDPLASLPPEARAAMERAQAAAAANKPDRGGETQKVSP